MSSVFIAPGSCFPIPDSRTAEPYSTSATSRAPRASPTRVANTSTVMRAMSEFSSCSTARKAASASESTEPSTAAPTAPAAATTLAQSPQDPPENPAARHDHEKDDEGNNPADRDLDAGWFRQFPRGRARWTGQRNAKLLCEPLR